MLFVLLLLLPLPPLECSGLGVPGPLRWCEVSRMLLIRPRLDWKPELLLLRRPREDILLASSAPSRSELYEYPWPLARPDRDVKVKLRSSEPKMAGSSKPALDPPPLPPPKGPVI